MSRIGALSAHGVRDATLRARRDAALWLAHALPLLCGIALLALLALAPLVDRAVAVDIGAEGPFLAPDETATVRRMAGFHEPEFADGVSYRWTKTWARLIVPNAHQLGDHVWLRLRLCGCHPDGEQPTAQLSLDNRAIAGLPTSAAYRRYTVLVPPNRGDSASDLFIELRTPVASFDGRAVGVRLDQLDLIAALEPALPWPEPLALAIFGAFVALVVARSVRDPAARLALLGALLFGPALVLGVYRHHELAPVVLVLAMLCGVLLVALARPGRLAVALPLAALAIALPLLPQMLGGWLVDDAFISFRYAQQLVAGHGLVFNPGERVEGYTNFLWTIIAAGVLWLGGDPANVMRLLTLLIGQASVVLCYVVGRRSVSESSFKGTDLAALLAPLLLATSGPFLLYSTRGSGLETALFTLLLLAGIAAYIAQRWSLCGALLAFAALTRPEGVLVLGLTAFHALVRAEARQRWRITGALVGTFMAIFLPYYLWRFTYYGLPLPNTFYVKVGASWAQIARGISYVAGYWAAEGWAWGLGLAALILAGAIRVWRFRADRSVLGPGRTWHWLTHPYAYIMSICLAYLAYIVAIGGDWLPEARFVVPLIPLFALLAQAGLLWLAGSARWGMLLAAALLAVALFDHTRHTLATSAYDTSNLIWHENDAVARRREAGRWLRANMSPETLVAVEAAGALPYYSQRPTIDILGLNDRHIAGLDVATIGQGKPGHEKTDIPYVLARHPTIIPYFAAPYFIDQPLFQQTYVREEHDGPEGYTVVLYRRIHP